MKIDEITKGQKNQISWLKQNRSTPLPNINEALKSIDPKKHNVMDMRARPKKLVKTDEGAKYIDVARIAFGLQKLIIKRAVAFCFGNDVVITSDAKTKEGIEAFNLIKKTMDRAKCYSLNRKIARTLFTYQEVAEYWYVTEGGTLGTDHNKKLRVTVFSPLDCKLYPFFDDNGDLIAFSREYKRKEYNKTKAYFKTYFETWTDEEYRCWDDKGNVVNEYEHELGKIPIIYSRQEQRETEDVDQLIDRLETSVSNFADTNDYHSSPKIVVNGPIKSFAQKGETGGIIEVDENTKPYYLSWDNAPQSKQIEFDMLLKMIYTLSQTPDVSFDNMKGVGAVSGTALKTLFTDAHLKVQDHREVLDEHLSRRTSVVGSYITLLEPDMKKGVKEIHVEQKIVPYFSTDENSELNALLSANGNKPLISHKQSVIKADLSANPEEDYKQIIAEESASAMMDVMEPAI